jgi:hypothetical protein
MCNSKCALYSQTNGKNKEKTKEWVIYNIYVRRSGGARGWQEGAEPPPERFEPPLESFETRIEIRKSYVMSAFLGAQPPPEYFLGAQPPPEYFLGAEPPLELFSGSATGEAAWKR